MTRISPLVTLGGRYILYVTAFREGMDNVLIGEMFSKVR